MRKHLKGLVNGLQAHARFVSAHIHASRQAGHTASLNFTEKSAARLHLDGRLHTLIPRIEHPVVDGLELMLGLLPYAVQLVQGLPADAVHLRACVGQLVRAHTCAEYQAKSRHAFLLVGESPLSPPPSALTVFFFAVGKSLAVSGIPPRQF